MLMAIDTKTTISISTGIINDLLRKHTKYTYDTIARYVNKRGDYCIIDLIFKPEDLQDVNNLYTEMYFKYDSTYLSVYEMTSHLTGIKKLTDKNHLRKFETIVDDELKTLNIIRNVLNATPKYDKDMLLIQKGSDEFPRVSILVKCDELVLI